ncbi:MAG: S8 family serine peptidase [Cyclobacteriaceae bacterium]
MRGFLTHLIFIVLVISVSAQKRYRLPSGIAEDKVDQEWIIVKIKSEATGFESLPNEVQLLHNETPNQPSILDGICKIRVSKDQSVVKLISQLIQNPDVIYAEPLLNYQLLYTPSDPSNTVNQNYLDQISVYDAWGITRGDDDITIGIIDTGIDLDHEDLAGSLWTNEADPIDGVDNDNNGYVDDYYGYDFADQDADPNSDSNPHGARAGGVAGATTDNSIGISGIGFNTKIAALKGFTTSGSLSKNLFEAIVYAADMGIDVLNLSWGSVRAPLQSEQDILNYAVLEKNVVVTVSAGNDGAKANPEALFYPASYDNVLSVGATDSDDSKWSSSSYNYFVDLVAPGVSIYSTVNDNGYGTQSGTSFASPMVAAVGALVKAEFPELNAQQIMERVRVSSDDIYNVGTNSIFEGKLGHGRLNAFNAVSQSALKSIRIQDFEARTTYSDQLFYGDTVTITANFTNFLSTVNGPLATISSPEDNFSIVDGSLSLPTMDELEESSGSFQIILDANLEPESTIFFRFDFMDGAYADYQFLQGETSPNHFNFGTNVKMTIAGNGNLGFADVSFYEGIGAEFHGTNVLDYAGLIIGNSAISVSDNLISNYGNQNREQNFSPIINYKLFGHPAADQFGYSEFEDAEHNLIIEQSSYSWEEDDFIILRYRINNNSAVPITDLSVGSFTDFDLVDPLKNKAEYDIAGSYILTKDVGETIFSGTKIIANGTLRYSALDVDNQNGNDFDVNGTFSDAEKYDFLRNQQIVSAGTLGDGNDVAMINGVTLAQIDPFRSEYFNVIIALSPTKSGLEAEFSKANDRLAEIIANPRIVETVFSCGNQVTLDPDEGDTYQFFEDAEGLVQLHQGSSFTTGSISQDSSFFIRNIDGAYPSDIFQIPVVLIDEVADFTMSPDTLYLDHDTNVVSFADQSFQAQTWTWDFDEGTISTLQNPTLSFNQVGEYDVSLSVENVTGCLDTSIKKLIVANRPASPTLSAFNICPGDLITISDPTADYLEVFENLENQNATHKGNNLEIGPFNKNSTIYVSGVYSQFRSLRVPIEVFVEEMSTDFSIEVDTTTATHQIVARIPEGITTFEWFVNDLSVGNESQIAINSADPNVTIRLDQTNANGCTASNEKTFRFSDSPIPSQQDIVFCKNENAVVRPENGEIFGFYSDSQLTSLIKKGKQLNISEDMKFFVVGLDDGLPSDPREVNVSFEEFEPQIGSTSERVGDKNKITLSALPNEGISEFSWYLDGELFDTSPNPTFVVSDEVYQIVVEVVNQLGCSHRDTLQLDLTVPLGVSELPAFNFHPNPSSGYIILSHWKEINSISVSDIAGHYIFEIGKIAEVINLNHLSPGVYLLKANTDDGTFTKKLIVR